MNEINEETGLSDADVIAAAVDVIRQRGWWRGGFANTMKPINSCEVCGWGAIHVVLGHDPYRGSVDEESGQLQINRCRRALNLAVGSNSFPYWQDQSGRTWEEVETKMLEVVAELESK